MSPKPGLIVTFFSLLRSYSFYISPLEYCFSKVMENLNLEIILIESKTLLSLSLRGKSNKRVPRIMFLGRKY